MVSLFSFKNNIAQSLGRVGNSFDVITIPSAGTVLMGGGVMLMQHLRG